VSRELELAAGSRHDPVRVDVAVNRGDAAPTSPEGRRIVVTQLDALWVLPRGALSSRATRLGLTYAGVGAHGPNQKSKYLSTSEARSAPSESSGRKNLKKQGCAQSGVNGSP
jgi:hypothetical protein